MMLTPMEAMCLAVLPALYFCGGDLDAPFWCIILVAYWFKKVAAK